MSSSARIYLRGVNLVNLLEKYNSGTLEFGTTPLYLKPTAQKERVEIVTVQEEKPDTKSFEYSPGSGSFFCLGHRVKDVDGNFGYMDPTKPFRCLNCCQKKVGDPWGIPLRKERRELGWCFHTVDYFCCPECMYRGLWQRLSNPLYANSLSLAKEMYNLWTGKDSSTLRMARDNRLLKFFGGPMNWENYHKSSTQYIEKPSFLFFFPIIEYIENDPSK